MTEGERAALLKAVEEIIKDPETKCREVLPSGGMFMRIEVNGKAVVVT